MASEAFAVLMRSLRKITSVASSHTPRFSLKPVFSDMAQRSPQDFNLPLTVKDYAVRGAAAATGKRKAEEITGIVQALKKKLCEELEPLVDNTGGNVAGSSSQRERGNRLLELAKPSAAVFTGLVTNREGVSLEPTEAPNVAAYLPKALLQFLAWQQLCEMNRARHNAYSRQSTGNHATAVLKDPKGALFEVQKGKPVLIGRKMALFMPDIDAGESQLISKRHAIVEYEGDELLVKVLGKNGITIDGDNHKPPQVVSLKTGSVLQMAGFDVTVVKVESVSDV